MYVILNFAYLAILQHYTQIIRLQTPLRRKCADRRHPLPQHFLTHFIFKNTPLCTVHTPCLLLSLFSSYFYNRLSSNDISQTVNYRLQKVMKDATTNRQTSKSLSICILRLCRPSARRFKRLTAECAKSIISVLLPSPRTFRRWGENTGILHTFRRWERAERKENAATDAVADMARILTFRRWDDFAGKLHTFGK